MNGFVVSWLPEPGNCDVIVNDEVAFRIRRASDGSSRLDDCRVATSQAKTGFTTHWRTLDAMTTVVRLLMEDV